MLPSVVVERIYAGVRVLSRWGFVGGGGGWKSGHRRRRLRLAPSIKKSSAKLHQPRYYIKIGINLRRKELKYGYESPVTNILYHKKLFNYFQTNSF